MTAAIPFAGDSRVGDIRVGQCAAPAPVDPLPEGTRVGDFEIVAVAERGDALTGYAALDLRDNREVRLMEFLPPGLCRRAGDGRSEVLAVDDEADRVRFASGLRRFLNQGRTLAHLDVPGLARVMACWPEQGTGYWVATAEGGRRLDRWCSGSGSDLPESAVWGLADRLIEALRALHRVRCLHLELSPARIVMHAAHAPILLEAVSGWRLLDRRNAQARALYQGHYAAPELHAGESHGEAIGPWTDVYALAATLFWLVTGEEPPRAADRTPGDVRRTLERLGAMRYSRMLLDAIEAGMCQAQEARSDWFASWADACRRGAAPASVIDDLLPAIVPGPAATQPVDAAAMDPVAPASVRRPAARGAARSRRGAIPVFWMAGAAVAAVVIALLLRPPAPPVPSEPPAATAAAFDWTPKPIRQALPH